MRQPVAGVGLAYVGLRTPALRLRSSAPAPEFASLANNTN
jgi:hypothetical protein